MIKGIGVILLVVGGSGYGFYMAHRVTERLRELHELYQMLLMIQGEIRYQNALLEEAFGAMANRLDGWRKQFLLAICEKIEAQDGQAIETLWRQEVDGLSSYTSFEIGERKLLGELGGMLGYLDKEMQMKTIEFYKEQLTTMIQELEGKKEGQCKLYQVLGIAGGAIVALVLL